MDKYVKNTVLIVHDHLVPQVSEIVKDELGESDWTVVGFKCREDAFEYLENNKIFAMFCDGEIPYSLAESEMGSIVTEPNIVNGMYLTRWLAKKGVTDNIPYLIVQWTINDVSEGPSENHAIYSLENIGGNNVGVAIASIVKAWNDILNKGSKIEISMHDIQENDTLNRHLKRGSLPWLDITTETIANEALNYIRDIRHKALSCYLAIYNDFQNIEYWNNKPGNQQLKTKIESAIGRIKQNSNTALTMPILGEFKKIALESYFTQVRLSKEITVTDKLPSDYENIMKKVDDAKKLEKKIRQNCKILAESQSDAKVMSTGTEFQNFLTEFQIILHDIVTYCETLFKDFSTKH